jgi:hypothetical protein
MKINNMKKNLKRKKSFKKKMAISSMKKKTKNNQLENKEIKMQNKKRGEIK